MSEQLETRPPCPGGCDNGLYSGPRGKVPCITCCPRTPNGDLDLAAFERGERRATTPDAVERDELLDLIAGLRGNFDEDDRYADRIEAAVAAERARHAEGVASMRDEIEDWEAAAQEFSHRLVAQTTNSDSLRDQLRRTEGARDVATRVAADNFRTICQLRDQLRKVEGERDDARAQVAEVQHEHDALLQRADQAERELGAWQDWALTHCDPGDGADDRHLRELVGAALTSLRSLLPDVRLIAESAMYETTGGESCPEVLTREARAARNILAALDSQKDGV